MSATHPYRNRPRTTSTGTHIMSTAPMTTRREYRAFRPLPAPIDRLKAAARELRALPDETKRLHAALASRSGAHSEDDSWLDPDIARRLIADAARIGDAILEHAELVSIELGEVAAHSHRYAADRAVAEGALGEIRLLVETRSERHSFTTLDRIDDILTEAGVQ